MDGVWVTCMRLEGFWYISVKEERQGRGEVYIRYRTSNFLSSALFLYFFNRGGDTISDSSLLTFCCIRATRPRLPTDAQPEIKRSTSGQRARASGQIQGGGIKNNKTKKQCVCVCVLFFLFPFFLPYISSRCIKQYETKTYTIYLAPVSHHSSPLSFSPHSPSTVSTFSKTIVSLLRIPPFFFPISVSLPPSCSQTRW